jgi:predicted nucleotidyltransferase
MIKPRDFIETKDGLLFAALGESLAFLRYYPSNGGGRIRGAAHYKKVGSTLGSFEYLENNYPIYITWKGKMRFQRCPPDMIHKVHNPISKLLDLEQSKTGLEYKCMCLNDILKDIPTDKKGVTGSILVNLYHPASDIDFVVYGEDNFEKARMIIKKADEIEKLDEGEWKSYYKKRFPSSPAIDFDAFLWHEKRKHNIGKIGETVFNLLGVGERIELAAGFPVKKVRITGRVLDATQAFNLPSIYIVDHETVSEVISFTHTFAGQANEGEVIEVSGVLEKTSEGDFRIVVGTSKEAEGEYIKVT